MAPAGMHAAHMTGATTKLQFVLRANAAFSAVGGLLAFVAASFVSDTAGIDHVILTRLVGLGLLVFAIDVFVTSRQSGARLRQGALLISIADITWVIASLAVIVTVDLTTIGVVVGLIQATAVLDFGVTQHWLRSRAESPKVAATAAA